MILTDYYSFERIATKAKTRLDCTASTKSYDEFEAMRATKTTKATDKRDATNIGDLVVYLGDVPEQFGGDIHRKTDKSLTIKGKNLSSVYVPDPTNNYAYGDVKGTADALLFVFDELQIVNGCIISGGLEIFVARGKNRNKKNLYSLLIDGELDEEMSELRARAFEISQNKEPLY